MNWFDRILRRKHIMKDRKNNCHPEGETGKSNRDTIQSIQHPDTIEIHDTHELCKGHVADVLRNDSKQSAVSDTKVIMEVGRQVGLREQKLEEIHNDLRYIRDKMALQEEIDGLKLEMRGNLLMLGEVLTATKRMILKKFDDKRYYKNDTNRIIPRESDTERNISKVSFSEKEKGVLNVLLQSGQLTYEEIGQRLGATDVYAKSLVNRILKKSDILVKETSNRKNLVGLRKEAQENHLGVGSGDGLDSSTQ